MVSRNNHYLSQMYLRSWAKDGKVCVYDLLVPDERVPLWVTRGTAFIGNYDSMYVRLFNGEEVDDIEKWFSKEYETPAKDALDKAIKGDSLTEDDWKHLIDFLACHIVRSPSFIQKTLQVQRDVVESELQKLQEELLDPSNISPISDEVSNDISIPINVEVVGEENEKTSLVRVDAFVGKQSYLWAVKFLLENQRNVLHNHHWSILNVDPSVEIPTTDNPVVFLNFNSIRDYNLDGGWNSDNTIILFPISPHKIVFCQVGVECADVLSINKDLSNFFKKVIVENAYKTIISNEEDADIPVIRPRFVDKDVFLKEKEMWKDFQKGYLEEESKYIHS